jgi:N-acetylmuramoyl-L-alanine amidase
MFLNLDMKNRSILFPVIFLIFLLFPALATASQQVKVKDIHHWSSPDYTRIVIELSEPVVFTKNRLSNPDRIFFDLGNASIAREIKTSFPVGDGILQRIRASQFDKGTVRVVFDIEEISDMQCFLIESPAKLIIDLYGKGNRTDQYHAASARRRIVIDAGHGGHDPGAVGPNKTHEKDVVLDIALKVKKILLKDPLNEVFLTREKDIFLPLEERTAFANRKNADLFVSIHANASVNRNAKGIETYLLNWTDDEEANRVAARENRISIRKMREMNRQFDVVKVITDDLMRQSKRDESVKLANYIQRSMVFNLDDSHKVLDHGVKQALFYVLFGAKMPSVLAEVSFISNPEEEHLLSRDSYRMELAKAIAEGVNAYFNKVSPIQRVAAVGNDRIR